MSYPAKKLPKAIVTALTLVMAIVVGAGIGYIGKEFWPSATPAQPVHAITPLVPKPTPASTPVPTPASVPPKTSPVSQPDIVRPAPVPAMPVLPVAGNLAIITSQRATLAEKKLQKEIDDLDAKSSAQPSNSAVVFSPDDVAKMLEMPAIKPETANTPALASPGTSVVAVQGVDGKLTATLRHNGKLVTLGAGEKFAGGTVAAISRQGVSVRGHNGVQTLAFE